MTTIEPIRIAATTAQETDLTPPKIAPRVKAAPKIRQIYWCDFPEDAHLREFWKRRPIVIISYKNTLHGAVTVIPCSTRNQAGNAWAFELETTIDGTPSWAICDRLTCVAVSRLIPDKGGIRRLPEDEFNGILAIQMASAAFVIANNLTITGACKSAGCIVCVCTAP